jgi:hypothetical protein
MQPGIDESDFPVVYVARVEIDLSSALGHREIVRQAFVVRQKEFANEVAAIAEAQYELLVAVMGVVAHQVPDYRSRTDIDERLRDCVRVLPKARSKATTEQDDFHLKPRYG